MPTVGRRDRARWLHSGLGPVVSRAAGLATGVVALAAAPALEPAVARSAVVASGLAVAAVAAMSLSPRRFAVTRDRLLVDGCLGRAMAWRWAEVREAVPCAGTVLGLPVRVVELRLNSGRRLLLAPAIAGRACLPGHAAAVINSAARDPAYRGVLAR